MKVKHVLPVLPAGVEPHGVSLLELIISPTGTVEIVRLRRGVQPSEPALDQAAIDAVQQWLFTPTLVNGVARRVRLYSTINFNNASAWK